MTKALQADQYINPIGGRGLYDKEAFAKNGIELSFLQPEMLPYKQFGNDFVASLSIVDCLMFNNKDDIAQKLNSYQLV
jgi:hypothetical protein